MRRHLSRFSPLVLACLLAACGGGGGDGAASAVAPSASDVTAVYVGTWALACAVTTPANPAQPDGVSEDEVLTVTRVDNSRFATSSVRSIYNNSGCSTLTSYYRSFPVTSQVEVIGKRTLAVAEVDALQFKPDDGSSVFKALAQAQGSQLYVTRADAAGVVLDADGYPLALDVSRVFTRAP